MAVVQRVVDHPAGPAVPDDPGRPQQPQRVRDGGFGDGDGLGQVTDAQLAAFEQRVEHPRPGRVAEQLEEVGQTGRLADVDQPGPDVIDPIGIDQLRGARVQRDAPNPISA